MNGFVIIPDVMENAMKRDLDRLRDSLPEDERGAFDAERGYHRQQIINHYAKHGTYPEIAGVQRCAKEETND
ncbi:MAG: hypothetical protein NXI13_13925 [Proteobacteria bacterium]|nr:hypothetical protein [Pseudomonadota bacterium]